MCNNNSNPLRELKEKGIITVQTKRAFLFPPSEIEIRCQHFKAFGDKDFYIRNTLQIYNYWISPLILERVGARQYTCKQVIMTGDKERNWSFENELRNLKGEKNDELWRTLYSSKPCIGYFNERYYFQDRLGLKEEY